MELSLSECFLVIFQFDISILVCVVLCRLYLNTDANSDKFSVKPVPKMVTEIGTSLRVQYYKLYFDLSNCYLQSILQSCLLLLSQTKE